MTNRRQIAAVATLLAAALAVFWATRGPTVAVAPTGAPTSAQADPDASTSQDPTVRGDATPQPVEASEDAFSLAMSELSKALKKGAAADAAAQLRLLLRTDPGALAQAYEALLSEETDENDRRALALVLGTLAVDGVDQALLAALKQFDHDSATVLSLIAALGALRDPPDEDDIFDMEAAPHFAFHGPGGMGITVRNIIKDPAVEQALGRLLLDTDRRDVRLAAASAMQFSVGNEFSRTRFRTALASEMDDSVAALIGQSLGQWTRRRLGAEALHVVGEVVQAADRPGFDEYRLRLETALHEASFDPTTMTQLRSWSQEGMSFELRSFAYSVLLGQRSVDEATRQQLVNAARNDPDRAIRDYAARSLANLPTGSDSRDVLLHMFDHSPDWSLRSTALTSLARLLTAPDRAQLLLRAANDPDARIARKAKRLSGR
ncbi:MAG: hypothetical protein ACI89X_003365 [Planctomycetota bacterium]|jgi:hypothetical protein